MNLHGRDVIGTYHSRQLSAFIWPISDRVLDWHPQIFTTAGYAVVGINRHGATGFGREFCDCLCENWGSYPYIDLEKGLAYVLEKNEFLDSKNVVGLGFSFGGYLINWLNGHSQRFKAFVNHGGMFSLTSTYYGTDELSFPEREVRFRLTRIWL
jgi:acylaminoacyl-peptidase